MARTERSSWLLWTIALFTLWRLLIAWLVPVTQDEAYYFDWARSLAWGYFDHPPGVALLGTTTLLAPESSLAARLGTVTVGTLTLFILAAFYRRCGLRAAPDRFTALVLAIGTIPGLVLGVLTTPDVALALAWVVALHEALVALQGDRRRWLTAGIATGFGLLGKYTMILIGPVFLWAILWADPRALRTAWPYLGGLLAFLVFAPHLYWNAENDWLTIRFQFGHGFSIETGPLLDGGLPAPTDAVSAADNAASSMQSLERVASVLEYLGTQLGLWGLLAPLLFAAAFVLNKSAEPKTAWAPAARELLTAGALLPLAFFGVVASFSSVEANWPVVYLVCAAPLISTRLSRWRRWLITAAVGNLMIASLYAYQAATAALPLPGGHNRILRETHGYQELSRQVAKLHGPVFADRYQTTAMLRFYSPSSSVTQLPGLKRPSEYLRGAISEVPTLESIRAAGGFWLVTQDPRAPSFEGFKTSAAIQLVDCPGEPLVPAREAPCSRPLHLWVIHRFDASTDR